MSVLREVNLCWSHFVSAKCARCEKLGHTFLACSVDGKKDVFFGVLAQKTLSNSDKSRLAAIYAKCSAPVAHSVSFSGVLWAQIVGGFFFFSPSIWNVLLNASSSSEIKSTLLVSLELNNRFVTLKCSLTSLTEHVDKLAKRLVKAFHLASSEDFALLLGTWDKLDFNDVAEMRSFFFSSSTFDVICSGLAKMRKSYYSSKLLEFKHTKESHIRQTIISKIESFELNKGHTIRSVLECFFCKVVLDHLVVGNELILEPNLTHQYQPLDYVFDGAFFDVMCLIGSDELFAVVSNLPNGKAASLSDVLTNTCPIVLIKTAYKIFSKIFLNRISSACSTYNVLHRDNFSVLKELWLVLQDMCKTYNSVGWKHLKRSLVRIKMCNKFFIFFGSIYNICINKIITDFGLTDGYYVHDKLNQREVFSPLLWCIFYDLLLCKVKRQKDVCSYRLNSYFVSKSGQVKSQARLTSFFATGAFVNNTIWISNFYLTVSSSPIFVAKKEKPYCYLGIFLFSKSLLKPSLAKAYSNIWFFVNLVLRKIISDKQFAYLNAMIHKSLKSRSGFLLDFPTDAIYYLFLYGLKTFKQIQAESKSASLVSFANLLSIVDNFLAGMVCIFSGCDLFLGGSPASAFYFQSGTFMSLVLGKPNYFKYVSSLQHYGITFINQLCDKHSTRLDFCGSVPVWFELFVHFLSGETSPSACSLSLDGCFSSDILQSCKFGVIRANLLYVNTACLSVYTDGFLSDLRTPSMMAGAAAFFENIDLGLGVGVFGLVSSTMTELQAIALALNCISFSHSVDLFLDSQAALDACKLESVLACLDFRNWCWAAVFSDRCLPHMVSKHFFRANSMTVFGNSRHFVYDIFWSIYHTCWEIGSGFQILIDSLYTNIDWSKSLLVWHSNSHLTVGFTNTRTASFCSYFIKTLHYCLSVTCYSSVVCLFCKDVEVLNHVFFCPFDAAGHVQLMEVHVSVWKAYSGLSRSSFCVLQLLSTCIFDVVVDTALCKDFVFNNWYHESVSIFKDPKAIMEKSGLILHDSSVLVSVLGLSVVLSASVVRLLGIANAFGISFSSHKSCLFFLDIGDMVSVYVGV
ncbi:hypothetical protein G9A89_008620 [Geosiphon pyriformis]|nr:hypothetical protein G9A89_008620 [Geosiphon pyriformis]